MRIRLEIVLAVLFGAAAVVTAVVPDWIEAVFGIDPDHGSGTLEWEFVAALGLAAVLAGALAWRDVRRRNAEG